MKNAKERLAMDCGQLGMSNVGEMVGERERERLWGRGEIWGCGVVVAGAYSTGHCAFKI